MTHSFIKLMSKKGVLLRNYTQNIDSLERVAGITSDKLVECHGCFSHCHCTRCNVNYFDKVTGEFCDSCSNDSSKKRSRVKAAVVLYGENLKTKFTSNFKTESAAADLCIVIGTSLRVPPVSTIPSLVSASTPRILINNERAGCFESAGLTAVGDSCATITEEDDESNDDKESDGFSMEEKEDRAAGNFIMLGSCDEECVRLLARMFGWDKELNEERDLLLKEISRGGIDMKQIKKEAFDDFIRHSDVE